MEGEVDVRETCLLVRWWLPLGWHFHLECGSGSWRHLPLEVLGRELKRLSLKYLRSILGVLAKAFGSPRPAPRCAPAPAPRKRETAPEHARGGRGAGIESLGFSRPRSLSL